MTFKKWQKPPKKWQKMSEIESIETIESKEVKIEEKIDEKVAKIEETPITTVVEEEISDAEILSRTSVQSEEEILLKKSKKSEKIRWEVGGTAVTKPKWRIMFEAQVAPVPMFKLPANIRQYLINKWFGTNVWKKDKEWLEKHGADMEMIEKLKKFLSGMDY